MASKIITKINRKGYKGFHKGLICKGKQYAENAVFEEEDAKIGESGMHFCQNPMGILHHYGFIDGNSEPNEFAEVEALGKVEIEDDESCTNKIKIGAKMEIMEFIQTVVSFAMKNSARKRKKSLTRDYSIAAAKNNRSVVTNKGYGSVAANIGLDSVTTNTGCDSVAVNTGSYSVATNAGYSAIAANTGDRSAAVNTDHRSATVTTGNFSVAINTGNFSTATSTSDYSAAINTGYHSVATNSGGCSVAAVEGSESIAIATGCRSKAKGALGCWIVVAERDTEDRHILSIVSAKVDGYKIKPDVFYTVKNGELVEAENAV